MILVCIMYIMVFYVFDFIAHCGATLVQSVPCCPVIFMTKKDDDELFYRLQVVFAAPAAAAAAADDDDDDDDESVNRLTFTTRTDSLNLCKYLCNKKHNSIDQLTVQSCYST